MGKSILKTDKFCFDKKEKEDVYMITHKQRIEAALEGKILDRPAYAMWGPHFNLEDRNVKDFTDATIRYQEAYDFDFIKVMRMEFILRKILDRLFVRQKIIWMIHG